MLFYRVENKKHKGPYIGGKLQDYIIQKLYDSDLDKYTDNYLLNHPGPRQDDILFLIWKDIPDTSYYCFGFESLDKVFNWFCLKEELEFLKDNKYQISIYETDDCYHGKWQSIANKDSLKLLDFIEF